MRLRRAGVNDAASLAAFGARTFAETFGADNAPDDLAAYLSAAYGERQQRAELADPDVITLLMEDGPAIVAFAQVRRGSRTPPCVETPSAVELWRFYVDAAWHGRGAARSLMTAVFDAARELDGTSLWLSVWERNARAIAFYTKCGFTDAGSKVFMVGTDRQTDRVLVKPSL